MASNNQVSASGIAEAIIDELRPLQAKWSRTDVERMVREKLESSKWIMSRHSRENIRNNRDHAIKLRDTISQLLRQISKAPKPVQVSMFSGMTSGPYAPQAFLVDLKNMERRLAGSDVNNKRDWIKKFSAETACNFFFFYSDKVPTSGGAASPMRIVAGLVYEYLTGLAERDLERSCEEALHKFRSHPAISTKWRKKSATLSQRH